jgi:hypothetical protein
MHPVDQQTNRITFEKLIVLQVLTSAYRANIGTPSITIKGISSQKCSASTMVDFQAMKNIEEFPSYKLEGLRSLQQRCAVSAILTASTIRRQPAIHIIFHDTQAIS